jgi:ferrous iron transport protein B
MNASRLTTAPRTIALVGHSNVGKSALFHRLTGIYTPVSNYPGTTVEVAKGPIPTDPFATVIDTPGVVTLPSTTEDERVTTRILLEEPLEALVQVGDAKNLKRTLLLAIQFIEMGIPLVLALNMVDELGHDGLAIDADEIETHLDIPVAKTIAVNGLGIERLNRLLQEAPRPSRLRMRYAQVIEDALEASLPLLPSAGVHPRALALLWLSSDEAVVEWIRERSTPKRVEHLDAIRETAARSAREPLETLILRSRMSFLESLFPAYRRVPRANGGHPAAAWTTHPILGLPVLLLVLLGLYLFVGVFAAGTLVDLLEVGLFGQRINPWVADAVTRLSPHPLLTDLIVGEFGLWTVGVTYSIALIFPIVTAFFLAFAMLEDSGYLPRLSVLTNRAFRSIGLNGRAVLPMILGLGCVTMATLSARTLESRRDRLLVILLLALAVPCSAQLGIVMGMLASISLPATILWSLVVLVVLFSVGWLAARLLPGESSPLLVELPPMRWPMPGNILIKTVARLEWYMKEVVPLFLLGAVIMFALDQTGILASLIRAGEPLVQGWLGLPAETSAAFVMGFLRRDFGATGLFLLGSAGQLSPPQIVVAMVTITLFVPCVASILVVAREHGWRTGLAVVAFVFPLAVAIGGLLHRAFLFIGWSA